MSIFNKAAKIAFKVAKKLDLIKIVDFKSVYDNGIDDSVTTVVSDIDAIREDFTQDDIRGLIFRDKIQPTDIKLLIKGADISNVTTSDFFIIDGEEFSVFGCSTDAANAVWTIGVR